MKMAQPIDMNATTPLETNVPHARDGQSSTKIDNPTIRDGHPTNQEWFTDHPKIQEKNPSRPSNLYEMGPQSSTAQCWNCGKLGHFFIKIAPLEGKSPPSK